MNAHHSLSSGEMDRETAALIAEVLAAAGIKEARDITLRYYRKWFHLIQGFWLAESRDGAAAGSASVLLNALEPVNSGMMAAGNAFRAHNPVLRAVLADPSRGPTGAADVVSKSEWEHNLFRVEVVQPMGLIFAISFHLDEGDLAGKESIFTPVLSRDGRDFSADERTWLARSRTMLEPIFAYLRQREMAQSVGMQQSDLLEGALSAAEARVFHWMRQGKRDKEIAVILGRSHRTVEKHVQAILAKAGVETRTAAVSLWGQPLSRG